MLRGEVLAVSLAVTILAGACVAAQTTERPETDRQPSAVIKQLTELEQGRLAVLLIFGTGFVSAVLWGLSAVVAAFRRDVATADSIRQDLAALEERVRAIEQAVRAAPSAGNGVMSTR